MFDVSSLVAGGCANSETHRARIKEGMPHLSLLRKPAAGTMTGAECPGWAHTCEVLLRLGIEGCEREVLSTCSD